MKVMKMLFAVVFGLAVLGSNEAHAFASVGMYMSKEGDSLSGSSTPLPIGEDLIVGVVERNEWSWMLGKEYVPNGLAKWGFAHGPDTYCYMRVRILERGFITTGRSVNTFSDCGAAEAGDVVIARSFTGDRIGGAQKVLCKKDEKSCIEQYQFGRYDCETGSQLDYITREPKADAPALDLKAIGYAPVCGKPVVTQEPAPAETAAASQGSATKEME